jgi:hypothetical protein
MDLHLMTVSPCLPFRRVEGYYSCTCPTWRNLAGPEKQRTCAHLKALLGEEYEEARIKQARSESPTTITSATRGKTKRKEEADDKNEMDTFPTSQGASQEKKAKTLYHDFNERANFGPRDLNGGVSAQCS